MNKVYLILTDSGGIQEEAPSLGKPVIVIRNETERNEAVEAGTVKLAGVDYKNVYAITKELLTNVNSYSDMAKSVNPYGDGKSSQRIVDFLSSHFI
jgi:UDP-N-acetylglucosamine 2-epimerase (non-hydrolysing)